MLDLGFVGEPEHVDVRVIHALTGAGLIPVIAPVGVGAEGKTYNINADTVAGAIAGALWATRLLMLTDVPGVLDADRKLIPEMTVADVEAGDRQRHHHRRHDPEGGVLRGCGALAAPRGR